MSEEPKHSPTPWALRPELTLFDGTTHTSDDSDIAYFNFERFDETGAANARFTCLAVNHHERLVEALRNMLSTQDPENPMASWRRDEITMDASALLAEIEGAKES